jgi:hypothetical protein
MSDDQDFLDAVLRVGQEFLSRNPQLADMIESARSGSWDPKEVVKEVWRAAAANQEFQGSVQQALSEAFGVEDTAALVKLPAREQMLERWGFSDEDLVFQPFEDRPDYKMLHPLLMGMIVELIQFDGDIPELRTGALPEGGSPAVPVKTTARNPVVIGSMLRRASEEVAFELGAAKTEHDQKVAALIEALPEGDPAVTGLVRQQTDRGIAVKGYGPGQRAQIREVEAPTGAQLARMPFEQKQELAHKALTSSQGRRSAVPVIADMMRSAMMLSIKGGLSVVPKSSGDLFADVEWGMQIDGGVNERNPNFNFIDTAAHSLTNKLLRELRAQDAWDSKYELVVAPINTIDDRRVGWSAALYAS